MTQESLPVEQSPVAIVGAGPSGLLLARYLQLHHIPCVVYEKEPDQYSRAQGGSLDLHENTGLLALRRTGLLDEARPMLRASGEAMKVIDNEGKVWMDENTYNKEGQLVIVENVGQEIKGRPEIDRTDLRNLLINSLEPGTIKWSHALSSCTALSSTSYQLTFTDPSQPPITTSYLVGADGAFSLVRPLLHSVKPEYSGVSMYDLTIRPGSLTPALQASIGAGWMVALGDNKGIMPQMNSRGVCKVYVGFKVPESWLDEHPPPQKGEMLEHIASFFDGWHEDVRDIIMAADEGSVMQRRIWQFDPDLKWESDLTGVTLMGDAAHVMSPFAGEGVNQALADALDLGETLVSLFTPPRIWSSLAPFPLSLLPISQPQSSLTAAQLRPPEPDTLQSALRAYERRMMLRVREYAIESKQNLEIFFGDDAARNLVSSFRWMMFNAIGGMVLRSPYTLLKSLWDSV